MCVTEILADQNLPSHMGREGKGHLAERRVKNQRSNQSNAIGRPVQELTNGVGVLNEKMISRVGTVLLNFNLIIHMYIAY